jgi:hypothetical protein
MLVLDEKYIEQLEQLAYAIQESDERTQYMETEEEEQYRAMVEVYEPYVAKLHSEVAANDPLQLLAFEQLLLNPNFEGMFLPKILGFSVLRGQVNSQYKYTRPQDHFKSVLVTICESIHFEFLKKRIGQTVQVGFALCSDIWITDLINSFTNRRLRYYLQSNKIDDYRQLGARSDAYRRYARQFTKENFLTASFPSNFAELKVEFPELKSFLMYRVGKNFNNESLNPYVTTTVTNPEFIGTDEHVQLMSFAVNFFDLGSDADGVRATFNRLRQEKAEFAEHYLHFLLEMHRAHFALDAKAEKHASAFVDKNIQDGISDYYSIADKIHSEGYAETEVMEAVKAFYYQHEGGSAVNECVRFTILGYLHRAIVEMKPHQYLEYFDLSKVFIAYMQIFDNEQFNQGIRDVSLAFVKQCLVVFIDKRARDYQDIKKFVSTTFVELRFIKEKDSVELFKTRRKRKTDEK